ncbi:MAG: hypothetical protein PHI70_07490 [Proteiniphilum sp.]|nr:hypothetical protein [Proteiniphilum sp.]
MQSLFEQVKIDNTYELLFPKKEKGLAVIWLYERVKNGEFENGIFKEKDIHRAFETVSFISREPVRLPWVTFNAYTMELQEFYLIYNDENQTYMFTDFGLQICDKVHRLISQRFNPTVIELTCAELYAKLEVAVTEEQIRNWLSIDLFKSRILLLEQVDYLNQQIDRSVTALSEKAKRRKETLLVALQEIEEQIDTIRQQNKELRAAFREIDRMNDILISHPVRDSSEEVDNMVSEAISYFEGIHMRLSMVDSRIDKIQPKIKQFFASLNQDIFNSKVEKFLYYLLEKSRVVDKQIEFPIPYKQTIQFIDSSLTFISVDRPEDLFPPTRKPRPNYKKDTRKEHEVHRKGHVQMMRQIHIQWWMEFIRRKSLETDTIHLSEIFFNILERHDNDLQLAIHVIDQVVKRYKEEARWKVLIDKNNKINNPNSNHTISDIWMKQK